MSSRTQIGFGSRMGNAIFLISAANAYSHDAPSLNPILIRFNKQFVNSVYAAMNIYYAEKESFDLIKF